MNYSSKTQLRRFLNNPKVRKVLNTKPLEQGFSLIELVVVVAILAILAAVALPNFLNVSKDAQIAAAKNTLSTIVKECATSDTRGNGSLSTSITADNGKLNGFNKALVGADCYTASLGPETGNLIPTFTISYLNGESVKKCITTASTTYFGGCYTTSALTTLETTAGNSGSW